MFDYLIRKHEIEVRAIEWVRQLPADEPKPAGIGARLSQVPLPPFEIGTGDINAVCIPFTCEKPAPTRERTG